MNEQPVLTSINARGVATVTLNRPQRNNAYNDAMIEELLVAVGSLSNNDDVKIIVLRGNGNYFQGGADLKWMKGLAEESAETNLAMSKMTTDAIRHLNTCNKPTIALVHGGCFGGGLGMMAACDITIASEEAIFSITETRWGLVAGPILPQLCDTMGIKALRRYALTAERFSAKEAFRFGLIHEICEQGTLNEAVSPIIDALLKCSPSAISETKDFVLNTAAHLIDDQHADTIAAGHALRRQSEDAIEGMASFNEKREASWYPGPE
jgi:methylglutaconyl-CoA hydratase